MKKQSTLYSLLLLVIVTVSCKKEASLQSYIIEASSKEKFYTGDLPISSLIVPNLNVAEESKEAFKSVKKINFVFLARTEDNLPSYQEEKQKLNYIFKNNDSYKKLMSMKAQGINLKIFYAGQKDVIDEVVVYGFNNEMGVGLARLLVEEMTPEQVMTMVNAVDASEMEKTLKSFKGILN